MLAKPPIGRYAIFTYFRCRCTETMYAYLRGKVAQCSPALLIVDVQGIGFELHISLNTYTQVQGKPEVLVFTYLHIKEDAHVLYGFADTAEKELFVMLLGVSGIGAATARMLLSSLKPAELVQTIATGNVKVLESVKGIGRKTAERLVLELRDKVNKTNSFDTPVLAAAGNSLQQDALNALVALGIGRPLAESALKKVTQADPSIEKLEDLIKKALKAI